MTQKHPITPPPELVREWAKNRGYSCADELWDYIAAQAARWGADQELEACSEWFKKFYSMETWMERDLRELLSARRPKPPSLKAAVKQIVDCLIEGDCLNDDDAVTLRLAMEALPDD